jgi:predicted RNase H-like HicB family nuclease
VNLCLPITIRKQPDGFYRASIDHGPGYHGIGKTPAEALKYAAETWYWTEVRALKEKP